MRFDNLGYWSFCLPAALTVECAFTTPAKGSFAFGDRCLFGFRGDFCRAEILLLSRWRVVCAMVIRTGGPSALVPSLLSLFIS